MPPLHALLVDDDRRFSALTAQGLHEHGVATTIATDGDQALQILEAHPEIDVVLLDVMMPGVDGWQVLEQARSRHIETPILFVTARESVDERVRGLRMGADDYIIKPFAFSELLARIEAVVRRRERVPKLECEGLQLDPRDRQTSYRGARVELSPREFDVLRVLLDGRGAAVSRVELLERVWHTAGDPGTNLVEVHVARIRRKLELVHCHLLTTVRGKGYAIRGPES